MKYTTKLSGKQIKIAFLWVAFIAAFNTWVQGSVLLGIIIGCAAGIASFAFLPFIDRM